MLDQVERLSRIERHPGVMVGQPVIKGTRMTVHAILETLAGGETIENLLIDYPFLTREDVSQSLYYAARLAHVGFEERK